MLLFNSLNNNLRMEEEQKEVDIPTLPTLPGTLAASIPPISPAEPPPAVADFDLPPVPEPEVPATGETEYTCLEMVARQYTYYFFVRRSRAILHSGSHCSTC